MTYLKAIVAGLIAALTAAATATAADSSISMHEGILIASALVAGFAAVYFTPNSPKEG